MMKSPKRVENGQMRISWLVLFKSECRKTIKIVQAYRYNQILIK